MQIRAKVLLRLSFALLVCGTTWSVWQVLKNYMQQTTSQLPAAILLRKAQAPVSVDTKKVVAVVVTVTRDGPYVDGALVLAESVEQAFAGSTEFRAEMLAIVGSDVSLSCEPLAAAGFKILSREVPVKTSEIRSKYLRDNIDKSGCCGAVELLKLEGYTLMQYHRVMMMDMDTLLLRNVDSLLREDKMILFTYDYAMHGHGPVPPFQGGFFVLKPSMADYQAMVELVREGDFRDGTGWEGTNIGWCYGGQTIQGLLPFYYTMKRPAEESRELDVCYYNNMIGTDKQKSTPFSKIFSTHFTVCQKPWDCPTSHVKLCKEMHNAWWRYRFDLETKHGMPSSKQCGHDQHHYKPIDWRMLYDKNKYLKNT